MNTQENPLRGMYMCVFNGKKETYVFLCPLV